MTECDLNDVQALDARAREILLLNDRGGYTVPTDGLYPYQWNWDSMFAAWGFAAFDLDRAWEEVARLFSGQWPNGMVPHILFHKPDPGYFPGPDVWGTVGRGPVASSGITQPPVAASFVRRLWERDRELPEAARLYEPLLAWHRWFMEWRCAGGVVFVTHPWEAGRDNAPDWDTAMAAIEPTGVQPYTRRDTAHVDASMRPTKADYDRYIWLVERGRRLGWDDATMAEGAPFRVADPGMTFILLGACRDLAVLGQELGRDVAEIEQWVATLETGAESLWNPAIGAYDGRDLTTGAFAGALTNASYLCWLGGVDDERMLAKFDGMLGRVPYPVPSLDPADTRFDARRYWRGPTWAIMNALIGLGLAARGHEAQARTLRRRTAQLIAEHGFAEYFDPLTGAPAGGGTFSWTAAMWLAWASPRAKEG
ncbi:MAG: hypothetical protein V2I65_05950 [Paracoccaceae bacterium]|jgi:glycogen debranching enzyme|nr:hypothetical protein [Paracoccaceae bacterium]